MEKLKRVPPSQVLIYLILTLGAIVVVYPFFFMVNNSVKTGREILHSSWSLPREITFTGYTGVFQELDVLLLFKNSLILAVSITLLNALLSALAGYAFAKMNFPGKNALFLVVLMTLMVPFAATLIPLFIIVRDLKLTNTYLGLILPALANPIGIFMMRQFIESLPGDLENAARLDGCSDWQIFTRVILPLMRPGLVVLGVFLFMNQWTSYLLSLIHISEPTRPY